MDIRVMVLYIQFVLGEFAKLQVCGVSHTSLLHKLVLSFTVGLWYSWPKKGKKLKRKYLWQNFYSILKNKKY